MCACENNHPLTNEYLCLLSLLLCLRAESSPASTSAPAAPMTAQQRQSSVEQLYFGENAELAYARGIELTNGRYAMLGFAAAILVEAATGDGILGQLIDICKWTGLLGERSGF